MALISFQILFTGLSLQSAVGLTAVVRLGSGRTGFTMAAGIASLEASTPRLVATASMAWILAVTAAAATAEALKKRNKYSWRQKVSS